MLIRYGPMSDDPDVVALLDELAPDDIASDLDVSYDDGDPDGRMDIFWPEQASPSDALPTIVWVHGGGFVAGDKSGLAGYLSMLADEGYTTVAVEYSVAPGATYPTPVQQVSRALAYLERHSDDYPIDPNQFVLAGDSAGAHIAGQTALTITNPAYAIDAGLPSALDADQLAATILVSGALDLELTNARGAEKWFIDTVLWAYSGTKDFRNDSQMRWASIPQHVSADFPPTFITAGNADPLLPHSESMAQALRDNNVDHSELFFDANHEPALNHEYQFNFEYAESQTAFDMIVEHLEQHTD